MWLNVSLRILFSAKCNFTYRVTGVYTIMAYTAAGMKPVREVFKWSSERESCQSSNEIFNFDIEMFCQWIFFVLWISVHGQLNRFNQISGLIQWNRKIASNMWSCCISIVLMHMLPFTMCYMKKFRFGACLFDTISHLIGFFRCFKWYSLVIFIRIERPKNAKMNSFTKLMKLSEKNVNFIEAIKSNEEDHFNATLSQHYAYFFLFFSGEFFLSVHTASFNSWRLLSGANTSLLTLWHL